MWLLITRMVVWYVEEEMNSKHVLIESSSRLDYVHYGQIAKD